MVSKRKGPAKLVTPPPSPESDGETILPEELMGEEDDKRCDEEIREEGVEEENPGSKEDEHIKQSEEDRNREAEEIEAESLGNEEEEHINQEEAEGNKESEESDDEQPMEPLGMYFSPSEYCKSIRVGSRCQVKATLAFIQAFDEVQWFEDHSQFRHVFHMPKEENHMSQGFLMLLLHTAKTEMDRECWFVVNGVPIRYSIREHGLLTKFDCNEYPKGYDPSTPVDVKDLEWAIRVFGKATVKIKDVKDKLEIPQSDGDRKKLLILLFLSNVLAAKAKGDGNIDRFLLRMADDVDACEKFPWGRYTFYMCLKGIKTILKCMKGKVEGQKNFGGFITPLEILAFEAIPQLAHRFRERVTAENVCGRMCKSKFKSSLMKGFPLDDINEELGRLKDITSILEPDEEEKVWLSSVVEEDAVDPGDGFIDPVVNMWRARLIGERKKIFWKQLYDADVEGRSGRFVEEEKVEETVSGVGKDGQSLKETMEKGFQQILQMLGDQNGRIQKLEVSVSELLTRKEGEKVPPPYECDDDVSYGRKAYEDHVSPKETDATVSPKTPEEHVSPMETDENVFAGPSGGNTCTEVVVYGDTTMGTALEKEPAETEAVEGDDETPEKEMKKKEPKKKEVKKKEVKKKEVKKKEVKKKETKKETKTPVGKRERKSSMHQKDPYTAEANRGKKKKMVKDEDEDEFAIKAREREKMWEIRIAKWEERGWIVEKLPGKGRSYRFREKK